MGIRTIIVPHAPGILCAQGLVASDLKEDFARTARTRVEAENRTQIREYIAQLMQAGEAWCDTEGLIPAQRTLLVTLDMRYVGQNFELSVPLDDTVLAHLDHADAPQRIRRLFFDAHEMQYGYHNPEDPVEIMNYRVTARGALHRPPTSVAETSAPEPEPEPTATRPVYFAPDRALPTPIYDRAALVPGHCISGPAVIEQLDATTLLYPHDTLRVDAALNLCIEVSP